MRPPPPCSSLRPMVRPPAHHLEVCIHAPTVAGVPRRRHPYEVTETISNPPKTKWLRGYSVGGSPESFVASSGIVKRRGRRLVVRNSCTETTPRNKAVSRWGKACTEPPP